jgi:hypothetical protein
MYENGGVQFVDRSMIRDVNVAQKIVRVGIAQRKEAGWELPEPKKTVSWIQPTKKSEANALSTWGTHAIVDPRIQEI